MCTITANTHSLFGLYLRTMEWSNILHAFSLSPYTTWSASGLRNSLLIFLLMYMEQSSLLQTCTIAKYISFTSCYRNPVPSKRVKPYEISRTLQESDGTLLSSSDSDEMCTHLGAPLNTSRHMFTELQNTYMSKL